MECPGEQQLLLPSVVCSEPRPANCTMTDFTPAEENFYVARMRVRTATLPRRAEVCLNSDITLMPPLKALG